MKITGHSKIIVKRAKMLNDAIHYDVELWAQLGDNPHARLVSFARKEDTINFVSTNGIHDEMFINDFSVALYNVPIVSDVELTEEQEHTLFDRIITTGKNFGTIRFDVLPSSEKSGQEENPFHRT